MEIDNGNKYYKYRGTHFPVSLKDYPSISELFSSTMVEYFAH